MQLNMDQIEVGKHMRLIRRRQISQMIKFYKSYFGTSFGAKGASGIKLFDGKFTNLFGKPNENNRQQLDEIKSIVHSIVSNKLCEQSNQKIQKLHNEQNIKPYNAFFNNIQLATIYITFILTQEMENGLNK